MSTKRLNFSVIERNVLLRLIEEDIEIVESKKNDSVTVRQKDKAWARIVARFNAERLVVRRTHRQLRKYWNNLKMRAKKSASNTGYAAVTLPQAASRARSFTGPAHHPAPRTVSPQRDVNPAQGCPDATNSPPPLPDALIKDEPASSSSSSFHFGGGDHQPVLLEASLGDDDVDDEAEGYHGNGDAGGGDFEDEVDLINSDDEEMGDVFRCVNDKDFTHETVAGLAEAGSSNAADGSASATNAGHWTAMDYARNEHEAKMALLTIQMETAHEQRELAREMREQTRQRHRLEMQVMEEKRRYRRLKMNSLPRHGSQS